MKVIDKSSKAEYQKEKQGANLDEVVEVLAEAVEGGDTGSESNHDRGTGEILGD